jgi:hypothetical protein
MMLTLIGPCGIGATDPAGWRPLDKPPECVRSEIREAWDAASGGAGAARRRVDAGYWETAGWSDKHHPAEFAQFRP